MSVICVLAASTSSRWQLAQTAEIASRLMAVAGDGSEVGWLVLVMGCPPLIEFCEAAAGRVAGGESVVAAVRGKVGCGVRVVVGRDDGYRQAWVEVRRQLVGALQVRRAPADDGGLCRLRGDAHGDGGSQSGERGRCDGDLG